MERLERMLFQAFGPGKVIVCMAAAVAVNTKKPLTGVNGF